MSPAVAVETSGERAARSRLRESARHWLPTVSDDTLDTIVAAAWLEALDGQATPGEPLDARAAAGVRRHAVRALRGEPLEADEHAEARIAALELDATSVRFDDGEASEPSRSVRARRGESAPRRRRPVALATPTRTTTQPPRLTRTLALAAVSLTFLALAWMGIGGGAGIIGGDSSNQSASNLIERPTSASRPLRDSGGRREAMIRGDAATARAGQRARRELVERRRAQRRRAADRRRERREGVKARRARRRAKERSAPAPGRATDPRPVAPRSQPQPQSPAAPQPAPRPAAPAPQPRSPRKRPSVEFGIEG
jgi:hypothetical protein